MRSSIRTANINIDTIVPNGTQWVAATVQRVEVDEDGNDKSMTIHAQQLHRRIDRVATEILTFIDPVTQQKINISVAGIGTAVRDTMIKWMLEDNPGSHYDAQIERVVLDGTS